jgi:hypothetical protein
VTTADRWADPRAVTTADQWAAMMAARKADNLVVSSVGHSAGQ